MKNTATIYCYSYNIAILNANGTTNYIKYDGYKFDDANKWQKWADEVLAPAKGCDNYKDIEALLYFATNDRIK
jgi:hypothetical protein